MKIEGNAQLVVYLDGKAMGVTADATLTLPESHDYVSCLESGSERTFEVSGIGLPELELTPIQEWHYQWYRSKELPRKAKKDYRKKLLKVLQ